MALDDLGQRDAGDLVVQVFVEQVFGDFVDDLHGAGREFGASVLFFVF